MEFRWVIVITLWTMLAGPVFDTPQPSRRQHRPAISASQDKSNGDRAVWHSSKQKNTNPKRLRDD